MPNRAAEFKSPYAKRRYTTTRRHFKKPDEAYVKIESMTEFDRFELREKKIHDGYLDAVSSGDSEQSALMASVYRKHHASTSK